jgi:hypothetical protein
MNETDQHDEVDDADTDEPPPWPTGAPDDSEPSPQRQAELRAGYEANVAAGSAPYAGVHIGTRGELRWVMQERRWSGTPAALPEGYERANLSGADLDMANLSGADLMGADLSGAGLGSANLSGAECGGANLSGAYLGIATLSGANLYSANLSAADADMANLCGADLRIADSSGATFRNTDLSGADLRNAHMDATTILTEARLSDGTRLADVVWTGVPLTRLNWDDVTVLGDERVAREPKEAGKPKDSATRLREFADAVLASRQVATVLRSQGLNEHADRFAYRAQVLQREVLLRQRKVGQWAFSLVLAALAGYGYRLGRILVAYGLIVTLFAAAYLIAGAASGQALPTGIQALDALQISLNAVHGRVFFAQFHLDTLQSWLATAESIMGIVIEGVFVALLIQRFFSK